MKITVIPKILFESEDIATLKHKNIKFESGKITLKDVVIECYKFYNMTDEQVFDTIQNGQLLESVESENKNFATRMMSIMFLTARKIMQMKDPELKLAAGTSLISAVVGLAQMDHTYARRILPLIRTIVLS